MSHYFSARSSVTSRSNLPKIDDRRSMEKIMSPTILGFTSKKAFKDLTFAIKEALPNSVKVADIRDAVAKFERFPSSNAYMDQLDRQEGRFICDENLVDPEIKKFASGSIKEGITPRYFGTFESMGAKTWNIWFFWTEDGNNYSGEIFAGLSLEVAINSTNFLNHSFLGYESYKDLQQTESITSRLQEVGIWLIHGKLCQMQRSGKQDDGVQYVVLDSEKINILRVGTASAYGSIEFPK